MGLGYIISDASDYDGTLASKVGFRHSPLRQEERNFTHTRRVWVKLSSSSEGVFLHTLWVWRNTFLTAKVDYDEALPQR